MYTRKDFYETLVHSLSTEEFTRVIGEPPADVQAMDYDFEQVHWNMNLEYAYSTFCDNEDY